MVGVAATGADILAFTDSDCLPAPRWLEVAVRALSLAVARQEISLGATLKLWSKPSCTRESATGLTPERR